VRSLTLRRTALAAVVPLALGTLAACGTGNDSSSTAADAAAPSSTSSSAATAGDTTPGSKVGGAEFLKLAQAAAGKLTTVKVNMTGDVSGSQYSMSGAMDITGAKPAMTMKMTATYTDDGAPDDISAPPSSDIIEMPGMTGNG
jgi:hypothetical protein